MRSISSGALFSKAPSPPDLADGRRPPYGPVELDFAHPGEADSLDLRTRALKHRRLLIDVDAHPHKFRAAGKQRNLLNLPDRNAGKGNIGALVEPADRLREINVVALGLLVREPGKPDDEQQHASEQSHRHCADHDIVR